jgi:hypothetical protein
MPWSRLVFVLFACLLARLACPWPLGAAWAPLQIGLHVLALAPLWLAMAVKAGTRAAASSAAFTWLFLSSVSALEAMPDKSRFGSASHVASALLALAVIARVLTARGRAIDWRQWGLVFDLHHRRTRRSLAVIVAVIGAFVAVELTLFATDKVTAAQVGEPQAPLLEALLYQLVVVAVAEELAFRGVLQGAIDRLAPGGVRILGAGLGWGALVSLATFSLGHMLRVQLEPLQVSFAFHGALFNAAVFVWLRAYTGSIWPAVALHGLWNGHNVIVKEIVASWPA